MPVSTGFLRLWKVQPVSKKQFNKTSRLWQEAFRIFPGRGNFAKSNKKINYSLRRAAGCVTSKKGFFCWELHSAGVTIFIGF
jgi:hypothetical protein